MFLARVFTASTLSCLLDGGGGAHAAKPGADGEVIMLTVARGERLSPAASPVRRRDENQMDGSEEQRDHHSLQRAQVAPPETNFCLLPPSSEDALPLLLPPPSPPSSFSRLFGGSLSELTTPRRASGGCQK